MVSSRGIVAQTYSALRSLRAVDREDATLEYLRGVLAAEESSLDVSTAASQLRLSARTLQRRLAAKGTTFQAELLRARLAKATTRMVEGKLSLSAIAFDLGFASPQHFSSRFSSVYGVSPSTWLRNYHAAESGVALEAQGPVVSDP